MTRGAKLITGLTALALCVPVTAYAGTFSWSNADGGNWDNGSNWQSSTYPKYFWDFAYFSLDGAYIVDATQASQVSVAQIEVTQGDVVLQAPDQLGGLLTLSGGTLSLSQGKLSSNDAHMVRSGGSLIVDSPATLYGGSTRNYAVDVYAGGGLYGTGVIDGNVVRNSGLLSAGSGPGTVGELTLGVSSGGLDQRAGAVFLAELDGSGHDHVQALQASLAGDFELALLDGYSLQAGDTFTVLTSATPLVGSFANVVWPEGADFELFQTEFTVAVRVTAVASQALAAGMDVKPGSCPNPVNVKSRGVLPVAVMFPPDTDLEGLDPASVLLAGVPALRVGFEDVSSPADSSCDCSSQAPDGVMDAVFHFDTQSVVEALGDVSDGQEIQLELTGVLPDGTEFAAQDCVTMLVKGNSKGRFASGLDENRPALWQDDSDLVYFRMPVSGAVRVTVHDVQGRQVSVLTDDVYGSGQYALPQPVDLSGGVYFYRLSSPAGVVTAKVVHLKR